MFLLIDGFFGYNKVLVEELDHLKTTFKIKWGTFPFKHMPFKLINVSATFQREMDITFCGLISQSVVVYLNNITIFSKRR